MSGLIYNGAPAIIADGSITPAKLSQPFTVGTAVNSTSGTAIDFTSIPSWVSQITVAFSAFSTNGTSDYLVRLGSGSVQTTGYVSTSVGTNGVGAGGTLASTSGFVIRSGTATTSLSGTIILSKVSGSNLWIATQVGTIETGVGQVTIGGGTVTLSGAIDRVRITTVNGTDTFDSGVVNILYA